MTDINLAALKKCGQSMWLDYLSREMIESGTLERLVKSGVTGVTSNPTIFEKAINGGTAYNDEIHALAGTGKSRESVCRELTLKDVANAADILLPVYEESEGIDGFVSLEVSPHLAYDAAATIDEARALWQILDRNNVMIKVPGTREGVSAVSRLVEEGININVTLLFGLKRYEEVVEAWLTGVEARNKAGLDVDRTASVASFFLSRIDTLVDPMLERCDDPEAEASLGQTAIACARLAYRYFRVIAGQKRFSELAEIRGVRPQRLLWASTGTKNPAYPDTHYVEPLIGADTINTVPLATLEAFLDHGRVLPTLPEEVEEAERLIRKLPVWGIDLNAAVRQLEKDGVQKFVESHEALLQSIDWKMKQTA